jgi:1-pyrroline-5-carboxylate dehydrogenase
MFTPFQNEFPYANFSEDRPRRKMEEALANVAGQLGRIYPLVIGGDRIETLDKTVSRNPARLSEVIGNVCDASPELADRAVKVATAAFPAWSRMPVEVRARYFMVAAAILRRRIYEFSAWMVYEAGKSWIEAYADTAEAIDFLEFYAREAIRWGQPHPTTPMSGEENEVRYIPLGVGAVIAPWNFPLAILCGMTAAAAVTGNTVIMKPAEQTPVIAAKLMELLELAGLPPGVVNFLPGPGETVGEALTGHNGIRFVSFTGSREVGLHIHQRLAMHQPGQKWIKRSILEMGGKDAIIVDEGVNLDGAAIEVVNSAFGFAGQKCSACSRLIAHTNIYDALLAKVVERAGRLTVGDPALYGTFMGPVVDDAAYQKIIRYITLGRTEGRLVAGGEPDENDTNGYFIRPTVIADVAPGAHIAQEEIFGPVLAVLRANDFDHALEIANGTDYGLTGAVFSYNRDHLERARQEFHVGNLYLNRKCTGALVDVQPFGGFNMSGTDSKAGGREYLGLFLQAKSVCERW